MMNGIGAKTGNMPPSPNDNAQCKLSGWESCGDAQLLSLYIEEKEKREAAFSSGFPSVGWATWIRTRNDRTRICSVTITP